MSSKGSLNKLFLFLIVSLICASSIEAYNLFNTGRYTGEYVIIRQDGFEENFNVNFEKVLTKVNENYTRTDTIICIETDTSKLTPNEQLKVEDTYKIEVNSEDKEKDFFRYTDFPYVKYCYRANPDEDYHIKIGESSIEVIQEYEHLADIYYENCTANGNNSHLTTKGNITAYLNFDINTSEVYFYDLTGNPDFYGLGALNITDDGHIGRGVEIQKNSADCPRKDTFTTEQNFTISIWFKPTNLTKDMGSRGYLFQKQTGSSSEKQIRFYREDTYDTGKIRLLFNYNKSTDHTAGSCGDYIAGWEENKWQMMTIAYNNTGYIWVYKNDTLAYSTQCATFLSWFNESHQIRLGYPVAGYSMNGTIDEVKIWNGETLNQSEISSLYNHTYEIFEPQGKAYIKPINFTTEGYDLATITTTSYSELNRTNLQVGLGTWNIDENYTGYNNYLSGHYPLDENSKDFGIHKIDGDESGIKNTTDAIFGQSYYFNMSKPSYIRINDQKDYINGSYFTYSMWIKFISAYNTDNSAYSLYGGTDGQNLWGFCYVKASDDWRFVYEANDVQKNIVIDDHTFIPLNTWTHIAYTVDIREGQSTNITIAYINGEQIGNQTEHGSFVKGYDNGIVIGGYYTLAAYMWNGSIDDVIFFNRSLTASEIKDIYIRGRANWTYSTPIDVTGSDEFEIADTTTHILPFYKFESNNQSTYSPILGESINYSISLEIANTTGMYALETRYGTGFMRGLVVLINCVIFIFLGASLIQGVKTHKKLIELIPVSLVCIAALMLINSILA